jgi:glycosyltransferase involved in cell wall biosynthesis
MPKAEAISQEVSALQEHFGGNVVYVNPNQQSPIYIPRLFFGFHKLKEIWSRETELHHLFNPDPFPFLYLLAMRRPIVYSVTCGVRDKKPNMPFFSSLDAIAVSDKRSLERLRSWGLENVFLVHPGIDTRRFTPNPLPLRSDVRLMVGSAPWTRAQFKTKGVDALLEAAQQMPELRLVFLWRGVLVDEMMHRVYSMELEDQVSVLNKFVDVNDVLAKVHASVTLAEEPDIVKSYPHSLLESLAAGKPVLVSRAIPMADYVEEKGCGVVVEEMSPVSILTAIESFKSVYTSSHRAALEVGPKSFSLDKLTTSFRRIYKAIS